jgi:predicted PurR-regulated permease PerM
VYASIVLYYGRNLFIPISIAILISFVLYPVCTWFERKRIGRLTAILISLTLLLLAGILIVTLLVSQFIDFLSEWSVIKVKLNESYTNLSHMLINVFGVTKEKQQNIISKLTAEAGHSAIGFVQHTISASAFNLVLLLLIPVYVVLILYNRKYWMSILQGLFPSERKESLHEMITLTIKAFYNFIKGMAIVYLIVGILNSIGLLLLGVPHAILFGFIASILTFIPYAGIIIGSLLPIAMAWITYDSIWYPIAIIAIFTFIQYLEANIIFPVAVSNRLNLNTLATLLAIFIGGILWGVAGMTLFVPFVGIIKLIADRNIKWKTVSMILGTENSK